MAVGFGTALYGVSALLALTLAVLLLLGGSRRHGPHVALAAIVFVFFVNLSLVVAEHLLPDDVPRYAAANAAVSYAQPLFVIAEPLLMLFFAALYPERLRTGRVARGVRAASLLALLVLLALYLADPLLFSSVDGLGRRDGPVFLVAVLLQSLVFVAALALVRDAAAFQGARRHAVHLVSFAFAAVGPSLDDLVFTAGLVLRGDVAIVRSLATGDAVARATLGLLAVNLLLFLALLGYACVRAARGRAERWYPWALVGTLLVLLLGAGLRSQMGLPLAFLTSFSENLGVVVALVLVARAFLHDHLYDEQVRVPWTIRRGAVVAAAATLAFALAALQDSVLTQWSDTTVWVGATTLAATFQGPLRRVLRGVGGWIGPSSVREAAAQGWSEAVRRGLGDGSQAGGAPGGDGAGTAGGAAGGAAGLVAGLGAPAGGSGGLAAAPGDEAGEVYRRLADRFWRAGALSREDHGLLAGVRRVSGLDEARALRIEEEAAKSPPVVAVVG